MRQYELMMILNPALAEAERNELIASIESELQGAGAKIASADHPGERDLAYKIRGSKTGFYLLYTLESEGKGGFFEVSKSFNIKTNIWRFMFVRIDE